MPNPLFPSLQPYLLAAAITAAATIVRYLADDALQAQQPFTIYLVAVIASARCCGFLPSLMTLFVGAAAARFFFTAPRGSFDISDPHETANFTIFLVFGFAAALIMRAERRATARLEVEVAERRRVEQELSASRSRFHQFIDNGPFAAFIKADDGKYAYVNKIVEQLFQMDAANWVGKTDSEIFPPASCDHAIESDRRVMIESRALQFDDVTPSRDGTDRHWSTIKFPLQGDRGERLLGGIAIDITAGRNAERQAMESEARLRLALDAGRMGTWSWNISNDRIHWSATQAGIHGLEPKETDLTLDESMQTVHPDDRRILQDAIDRALGADPPTAVTYRSLRPDGAVHWIEAVGRVLRDEAGRPTQVAGVCTDVTERKAAELELRKSEERFRFLAMNAPVGIAQSDAAGSTHYANAKWLEILGATAEEAYGFGWQKFLHPDERVRHLDEWQTDISAGRLHSTSEFRIVRKDGSTRWVVGTTSPLHDADGVAIGQVGVALDVTDRKLAQEALRESEERFRAFMDNSPVAAWAKDDLGRYVYFSRGCRERTKINLDDWLGKTDAEVLPPELAQQFQENDRKVLASAEPIQVVEESGDTAGDRRFWLSTKFVFHDRRGLPFIGGVGVDITDLKQTEQLLRSEQELLRNMIDVQERERRMLCQEFHDGLIQYAIGSLMALTSFQQRNAASDAAEVIEFAVTNLRKGIDDGRRALRGIRPAVLDDSPLDAAIEDLVDQYSGSQMMVTCKCDPEIGKLSNSVQTTVYRVVQEALNNARKHSGTDVVRIVLNKVGEELQLEIRDFGCGFDVAKSRRRGFGLVGMAERVRLIGGECNIHSERDVGTTISVRLPIRRDDAAATGTTT